MAKAIKTLNVYRKRQIELNSPICGLLKVHPAFAVDVDNSGRNETAASWANTIHRGNSVLPILVQPNEGFRIRIINLESRDEGGRAYKVVDQHGHMYDLRERVVLDIITRKGIEPGGAVPGEFKWVVDGSQMLLAPVDSDFVLKAERMEGKVPAKKFVPFCSYSDKKESVKWLYLAPDLQLVYASYRVSTTPQFAKNPLYRAYTHEMAKTVYQTESLNLGPDPAEGLIHAMVHGDCQEYARKVAHHLRLLPLYEDLKLHPQKVQLPSNM